MDGQLQIAIGSTERCQGALALGLATSTIHSTWMFKHSQRQYRIILLLVAEIQSSFALSLMHGEGNQPEAAAKLQANVDREVEPILFTRSLPIQGQDQDPPKSLVAMVVSS